MTLPIAPDLAELRSRTSAKWRTYADDVLPLFIAEMDYPLAPVVAEAIVERVRRSDVGYVAGPGHVGVAFAGFAARRWQWEVDPADIRVTTDVSVVIVEALRVAIRPGDGVVLTSPVYPPFFELIPEAGGRIIDVPLVGSGADWRLDLAGIEQAFAGGARAMVLCQPNNPLGLCHPREELAQLAELAAAYGVIVVSDEIHAPLAHPGAQFVPFLSTGEAAREIGIAAHSASKAFNVAGAKCAQFVAVSETTRALLDRMPREVGFRTSLLGAAAAEAAYAFGDEWLDLILGVLGQNLNLLESLLYERVPDVRFHRPSASFLAWLDFRGTELGPDPAAHILDYGQVALHSGPAFGPGGVGFARLNFACAPDVLTEAVDRIGRVVYG
ncbi:MalY/PatB family protein [Gordonia soli]|uniref:cysteine-S-conjugate beta-lyase n=1 Tax=Gordonia soli NBRC 108243 TaxID=1223545 RepID=M0QE47_9ACTN|nr:aminotransferase class I/II-fold pyridoxal phosphate-dependent enzyme [Gordonia soli]GAC66845.1 putative aminotransferase [Gordonia soli NBRC 108243]